MVSNASPGTGWVLETSPSDHYWWRYVVGQWLVFGWFWGYEAPDTWLVRRKLGKNKHTPTMVAAIILRQPWCPTPGAKTNMLRDKSMLLKIENIFAITVYILFNGTVHCRQHTPTMAAAVGLRLPWCHTPSAEAFDNHPICYVTSRCC